MRIDLNQLVEGAAMDDLLGCLGVLNQLALPGTLAECAERLDRFAFVSTQDDADTYLGFFQAVANIHALYEHYFPGQFARSTKSIVPALDEAFSEREREFFGLVDDHLFPLPWYVEDVVDREERFFSLPIVAMGREWWNDGLDDWELGWLLLLWLLQEAEAEDELRKRFPDVAEALFALPVKQGTLAFSAFERACRQARTPLAYLPEALNILYHDTGSWFLDITTETADAYIDWTREDIDRAIVHMRRATRTTNRADRFITWVDEDPLPRFKEVLTLWNLYCHKTPDNLLNLQLLNPPTES